MLSGAEPDNQERCIQLTSHNSAPAGATVAARHYPHQLYKLYSPTGLDLEPPKRPLEEPLKC